MGWIKELRKWHEARLEELNYPKEIVEKLQQDREDWIIKNGRRINRSSI